MFLWKVQNDSSFPSYLVTEPDTFCTFDTSVIMYYRQIYMLLYFWNYQVTSSGKPSQRVAWPTKKKEM